jgi:tetratricopeptide (TPR) repeat protein
MGIVHQLRGDLDGALDLYRRSLETFEQLGDRAGMAKSVYQIGQIHELQGDLEKAEAAYQRSLELDVELQNVPDLIIDYRNLASLALKKSDWNAVADHFAQALLFSLQVTPRLALETVMQVRTAAERLLASGQAEAAAQMAGAGLQVAQALLEKLKGEKQQAAARCGDVLQVIRLAASGQRAQALERAKQVDEATQGMYKLEEWVEKL